MNRIALSRREKHVLRILQSQGFEGLSDFDRISLGELERLGLIKVAWIEGHEAVNARLTDFGKEYLFANPRLHNPINWTAIAAAGAWVAAIVSLIALFIACSH